MKVVMGGKVVADFNSGGMTGAVMAIGVGLGKVMVLPAFVAFVIAGTVAVAVVVLGTFVGSIAVALLLLEVVVG